MSIARPAIDAPMGIARSGNRTALNTVSPVEDRSVRRTTRSVNRMGHEGCRSPPWNGTWKFNIGLIAFPWPEDSVSFEKDPPVDELDPQTDTRMEEVFCGHGGRPSCIAA